MADKETQERVFIPIPKSFVHERTGENGDFLVATIPPGVKIDGVDVGGRTFSPLYKGESQYRKTDYVIPMRVTNKDGEPTEIWLNEQIKQEDGSYLQGEVIKVTPQQLKDAIITERKEYSESQKEKRLEKSKDKEESAPAKEQKQQQKKAPVKAK